jgi:hypothetical protein
MEKLGVGGDDDVGFENCFQPGNVLPSGGMPDPVHTPNNTKQDELKR